jgi:hypothetical protein
MSENKLIAQAIRDTLMSPNVSDSNWEAANLVDIAAALWKLAKSDDPKSLGALEAHGAAIKEAAGLLAEALYAVADAIRAHGTTDGTRYDAH